MIVSISLSINLKQDKIILCSIIFGVKLLLVVLCVKWKEKRWLNPIHMSLGSLLSLGSVRD